MLFDFFVGGTGCFAAGELFSYMIFYIEFRLGISHMFLLLTGSMGLKTYSLIMFLTFSEVFFTNAIGVNNDSCGGSQNSFQERCSCNITNISRSIRTGISTQTYSNFFRFY